MYFLATTFARTCVAALCMCFICPVRAWLLMFSRPSEGGVMSQFAQEMFRQHLQSSVRTPLLQLNSDSRTIVFLAEHAT